ncbi:MAG: inositol phosphatase [Planctomycetes bacterium]|nr:inositol phosphatase [Planctomycetota bacterium]
MSELDLPHALDVARRAVAAAARVSLPYFERGVTVETKSDDSPVTAADRAAEAAILTLIRAEFPAHAILAEETGAHAGSARTRWIVDPLDGTRGFARGGTFWGPLVALEHEGQVVAGAFALPALGKHYWGARGLGAYRDGTRLAVSRIAAWKDATLSLGELRRMLALPEGPAVAALITSSASTRSFGDPAAPALVLDGRAECWLEAGVQTWDLAPFAVLLEEAGGRFSAWDGTRSIETGAAVGSNGLLHAHVLAALRAR